MTIWLEINVGTNCTSQLGNKVELMWEQKVQHTWQLLENISGEQ